MQANPQEQFHIGDEVVIYGFGLEESKETEFAFYEGDTATIEKIHRSVMTVKVAGETQTTQIHKYQAIPSKKRLI